jgi:transketolase
MDAILSAFDTAKEVTDKPSVILANTVKGKGVSFMEGDYGWHGQAPSDEQLAQALIDLGGAC